MTETPDGDPNGQSREHDWPEPADAASREICFQQGKAWVYEAEDGNGAGKSTWCSHHRDSLPEHFYNPDAVAEGIGGWNRRARQREAGELVARRIQEHLEKLESFGFESTYSGRTRPRIVERAKALGYEVDAVFIGTRTAEINVERVAARVTSRTGHAVATTEIHRRWRAAQDNLARTAGSFSRIALWDNSGGTTRRVGHMDATDIPVLAKPTPECRHEGRHDTGRTAEEDVVRPAAVPVHAPRKADR